MTEKEAYFVRFNLGQRIEHITVMVLFTLLVLTGLPQKYSGSSWAQWIILTLGGIDITRLIHRIVGVLFAASTAYHLVHVTYLVLARKVRPTMLFNLKDVRDAIVTLRYCLGTTREYPQHDRYDYRQKFEYWGILFGGGVMIATGAVLMFPILITRLLPGELVAAAKEAHTWEALLAVLTIVVWHLYGAHLAPDRFPADTSIFTGKISRERALKEHPLEYGVVASAPHKPEPKPEPAAEPPR
ncbi:MAG: deca-heme C-type cytochrome-like protein [Dehalococcoidia bacterium]|nr:deca-heme C-type cytochrome-like protein [Dehalococcoidia bacterium]